MTKYSINGVVEPGSEIFIVINKSGYLYPLKTDWGKNMNKGKVFELGYAKAQKHTTTQLWRNVTNITLSQGPRTAFNGPPPTIHLQWNSHHLRRVLE